MAKDAKQWGRIAAVIRQYPEWQLRVVLPHQNCNTESQSPLNYGVLDYGVYHAAIDYAYKGIFLAVNDDIMSQALWEKYKGQRDIIKKSYRKQSKEKREKNGLLADAKHFIEIVTVDDFVQRYGKKTAASRNTVPVTPNVIPHPHRQTEQPTVESVLTDTGSPVKVQGFDNSHFEPLPIEI